jgi:hypothetical protein
MPPKQCERRPRTGPDAASIPAHLIMHADPGSLWLAVLVLRLEVHRSRGILALAKHQHLGVDLCVGGGRAERGTSATVTVTWSLNSLSAAASMLSRDGILSVAALTGQGVREQKPGDHLV